MPDIAFATRTIRTAGPNSDQRPTLRDILKDATAASHARLDAQLGGENFDLRGCAVNDHHANVERAQDGDIEENVGEVFVGNDPTVDREDEGLLPKAWDVLKDAPEISQFHQACAVLSAWFFNGA